MAIKQIGRTIKELEKIRKNINPNNDAVKTASIRTDLGVEIDILIDMLYDIQNELKDALKSANRTRFLIK